MYSGYKYIFTYRLEAIDLCMSVVMVLWGNQRTVGFLGFGWARGCFEIENWLWNLQNCKFGIAQLNLLNTYFWSQWLSDVIRMAIC